MKIRAGELRDRAALQVIELLAGERFRDVGYAAVADHDPFSREELAAYMDARRCWVAVDATDAPIGYVVVDVVDGNAHVEQVSVLPAAQGQGVGRSLMGRIDEWATVTDCPAVTLTAFTEVEWNAPLYRHLGFERLTESEIGPQLRVLRDVEAAHGLDPAMRVCMRKRVGS